MRLSDNSKNTSTYNAYKVSTYIINKYINTYKGTCVCKEWALTSNF